MTSLLSTLTNQQLEALLTNFFGQEQLHRTKQFVQEGIAARQSDSQIITGLYSQFEENVLPNATRDLEQKAWRSKRASQNAYLRKLALEQLGLNNLSSINYVDFGAGEGDIMAQFQRYVTSGIGYGVDIASWHGHTNLQALTGVPNTIPIYIHPEKEDLQNQEALKVIPSGQIDVVCLNMVLHHLATQQITNLFRLIWRVLKPTGLILVKEHDVENVATSNLVHLQHLFYNRGITIELDHYRSRSDWQSLFNQYGFGSVPFNPVNKFSPEPYGPFRTYFAAFQPYPMNKDIMVEYIQLKSTAGSIKEVSQFSVDLEGVIITSLAIPSILPPKVSAVYHYGLTPVDPQTVQELSLQNGWFMYLPTENNIFRYGNFFTNLCLYESKTANDAFGYTKSDNPLIGTYKQIAAYLTAALTNWYQVKGIVLPAYVQEVILQLLLLEYTPSQICEHLQSIHK